MRTKDISEPEGLNGTITVVPTPRNSSKMTPFDLKTDPTYVYFEYMFG